MEASDPSLLGRLLSFCGSLLVGVPPVVARWVFVDDVVAGLAPWLHAGGVSDQVEKAILNALPEVSYWIDFDQAND